MSVLEARNVSKSFPGVKALNDVSVTFEPGKIYGIIGENGAGKSTLVKILTGVYPPDEGQVLIEGQDARANPRLFAKVAYAPQEIDLFPHMTVAENLFIPFHRVGFDWLFVNRRRLYEAARPYLERFKISAQPTDIVRNISVSNQQLVQIARATANKDYRVLILDEPTTSLTLRDVDNLFAVLQQLKAEGKAIVFISHKLEELQELCDEITVLRNGVKVGHEAMRKVDRKWIVTMMSGRNIDESDVFRPRTPAGETLLKVEGLTGKGFADISFELRRGEVLGFAGLVGSGRSEIMQTIFGILPARKGSVTFDGRPWRLGSAVHSVKNGLFYLPEERKQQGILPHLSVRENIAIALLDKISQGPIVSGRRERSVVHEIVKAYDIRTPTVERKIVHLSGGNQQKVIIGRSMSCEPKVLIFDEPTKGIDVGTKFEIYKLMQSLVEERGVSIILISSELEELLRCANRVLVIYRGRVRAEFDTATADTSEIVDAMIGGSNSNLRERLG